MDNSKELKHISLCAGYGGIDLGLSRALGSIRTVCFVEIEAFAIQNLVAKIEKGFLDQAPIFTNLKTFHWELFHGKVDILSGGFPCQPFSAAGRRKGSEDPRHLWPYITDGIKRLGRPSIVFFENVEGIISSKLKGSDWRDREGTSVLLHVLRELERLGYKATAGVFSASEVGAPHQRKRVFILGVRNDLAQTGVDHVNGLIKSNQSDRVTAWPASRGQCQYCYEPPRVTMGDSEHNGSLDSKESGDTNETSNDSSKGQKSSIQSKRASRPCGNGSLQTSELGDSNGRNKESHGFEHRILHSKTECREAGGLEWTSDVAELGNTTSKRSQGSARPIQKGDLRSSSTNKDQEKNFESSLGGNVDGTSDWMDHAKLFESCDNRTDELRLLGNGVVPDTASKAFKTLWYKINQL